MSTTLFFLVPIGMLAVVWSLCFVGCLSSDQRNSWPTLQQYHSRRTKTCRLLAAERFTRSGAGAAPGQHHRWHRPRSFRKRSSRHVYKSAGLCAGDDNSTDWHQPNAQSAPGFDCARRRVRCRKREFAGLRRFRRGIRQHSVGAEFATVDRIHTRSLDQTRMDRNAIQLGFVCRTYHQHRLCDLC